jgi:thioredoxin reductase
MDTWRTHMPAGMHLKSEPYASSIAAPRRGYDLPTYCANNGFEFAQRVQPVPLERLLGYADWFAGQLVPDVRDLTVTKVTALGDGFEVEFSEAAPIVARQVIVATGVLPHRHVPDELSELSGDLVTHASDHHDLTPFHGRRVAVIGAGQSALETAALLNEQGAEVHLVVRGPKLKFVGPNPERISPLGKVRRPVTRLCEGWKCALANTPAMFRLMPEDKRVFYARAALGPSGTWWLRDRIVGVVDVLTDHRVREAQPHENGLRLALNGSKKTLDVDHVIAGTGFHVDVAGLPFLPKDLLDRIPTAAGYPALSRASESPVPGLYFAGALAAGSLGPSGRFIAGTHNEAAVLARSVARRARSTSVRPASATAQPGEQAVAWH